MAHTREHAAILVAALRLALLAFTGSVVQAQLNADQKSVLLTTHNERRSSTDASNMLQLEWSTALAARAQAEAAECIPTPSTTTDRANIVPDLTWIGANRLRNAVATELSDAVECWFDGVRNCTMEQRNQVLFAQSSMLGCGMADCSNVRGLMGSLLICYYGPGVLGDEVYSPGSGCEDCPEEANQCINDRLCSQTGKVAQAPSDTDAGTPTTKPNPDVKSLSPTRGSLAGGTKITINGTGFSTDQFNFPNGTLGNRVFFTSTTTGGPSVVCDVVQYSTNSRQIVCTTRASPNGQDGRYRLNVEVDGTTVKSNIQFRYRNTTLYTPTVREATPLAFIPGEDTVVNVTGNINTIKVADTQNFDEDIGGRSNQILTRLLVGGESCDPRNGAKQEYGGKLLNANSRFGTVRCRPTTRRIDSMNVSLVLSESGKTTTNLHYYSLDNKLRHYLVQSHPDISRVEPNVGSADGGTIITIHGRHFNDPRNDVQVKVGGVPCVTRNVTATTIQCTTGPAPPSSDVYPGGRGLVREVFMGDDYRWNLDIVEQYPYAYPNSSAGMFTIEERSYRTSSHPSSFGERVNFNQRYTGFFVPPITSDYIFSILSDDRMRLFLSPNTSRAHKEMIADAPAQTTNRWNRFPTQSSRRIRLEAGKSYYMEALHSQAGGPWRIAFGVKALSLNWTDDRALADHEEQEIDVSSVVVHETQRVKVTLEPSVQSIVFTKINSSTTIRFQLQFVANTTTMLATPLTTSVIETALNSLPSIASVGSVQVRLQDTSETLTIQVIFVSLQPSIPSITVVNGTGFSRQTPSTVQSPPTAPSFSLGFGNRATSSLTQTTPTNDTRDAVLQLFSTSCQQTNSGGRQFWVDTFDINLANRPAGTLDSSVEPYCGRYSLKHPGSVWSSDYTSREGVKNNGRPLIVGQSPTQFKYICLAYRGTPSRLLMRTPSIRWYVIADRTALFPTTQWRHVCFDLFEKLRTHLNSEATQLTIDRISFEATGDDYWIDEVSISTNQREVTPIQAERAVRPGGVFVNSLTVSETQLTLQCSSPTSYTSCQLSSTNIFTFTTHDCGYGMPLMTIANDDSRIMTERVAAGSLPVTGHFNLALQDNTITDIPVNSTGEEMKELLENGFSDQGGFAVTRSGSCAGYKWLVRWTARGGDQPTMNITDSDLAGVNASVTLKQRTEGGVFFRPLRGDMLRLPETSPQVEVIVNGIPASCQKKMCSFTFSEAMTPRVVSFFPMDGGDKPITIIVANVPSDVAVEAVTIGNAPCNVTSYNSTHIVCEPSMQMAGLYPVRVQFSEIGYTVSSMLFEYTLAVDDIDVTSGGVGGGNVITISGFGFRMAPSVGNYTVEFFRSAFRRGYGFSQEYHVLLDDNPCMIMRSNLTSIMCVPQPHAEGMVNLTVVVGNQTETLPNAYEYTQSQTPVIRSITPAEGSVFGGTIITIRGNNFGDDYMFGVVIGNSTTCVVNSQSNEEINCTTTQSAFGSYPVFMHSRSRGQAILATAVTSDDISGHAISLDGSRDEDNSIPPLYPIFSYKLRVTALSPCSGSLAGGTEVMIEGEGFGDNSSNVMVSDGNGRSCQVTTVTPTLIRCRTSPHNNTLMAGDLQTSRASFRVRVHGFEAMYGKDILDQMAMSSASGERSSGEIGSGEMQTECQSCQYLNSLQSHTSPPLFVYSPCDTPLVTGVYPNIATLIISQIKISGERFSTEQDSVSVEFGDGHRCNPISVTMTTIVCQLNQSSQPPPFTTLPVRVYVRSVGSAFIQSSNNSISINPIITQFSPSAGSIFGGNRLTINGGPFSERNASVRVGGRLCLSPQVSYDYIMCTVPAANTPENATIQVSFEASNQLAMCRDGTMQCSYGYSESSTPRVTGLSPSTIGGGGQLGTFTITGSNLNSMDIVITIGPYRCTNVTIVSTTEITCSELVLAQQSNRAKRVVSNAGTPPAGLYSVSILVPDLGFSRLEAGTGTIISTLNITSVTPSAGSVAGGTIITLIGSGFHSDTQQNVVTIGNKNCTVTASSYTSLSCRTSPQPHGLYSLKVIINGVHATSEYNHSISKTPTVTSITPNEGQHGNEVIVSGTKFSSVISNMTVMIGGSPCAVSMSNETAVRCTLGAGLAGEYPVTVNVSGLGRSLGNVSFRYVLSVSSVSPTQGSFAGQSVLTLNGVGFNPVSIYITVCNRSCLPTSIPPNTTTFTCTLPSFTDLLSSSHPCDVVVSSLGRTMVINNGYTLQQSLTPRVTDVNRTRGGTGGGSIIEITGEGFTASVAVTIAMATCNVTSFNSTKIVCVTGRSTRTIRAPIMVFVEDKGFAISSVEFHYLDLWSSRFTWGGESPPEAGTLVVVPKGQTLVLNVRTEVLKVLLIQGGELIFDDEADGVELHSENIIIVGGGKLQVGTEDEPYQHKARIVMYGNVLSTEIPLFGAKTLAVRDGTLDLHGKKIEPTWTRLSQTVRPGDTMMHLEVPVSGWEVGGSIVIASTSFSQRENEELRITAIGSNGTTLTVSPPLKYTHIAMTQTISGRVITTSAEVGYLTRNIVVKGNTDETWTTRIENCPADFDPGQFAVQVCFFGRFGAEEIDDQFGSQIMLHKGPNDKVVGRIEYVEVTRAGQAFRLGRYPIHFHLNGDVNGSYVRGCGIHHTFNRAVTVHAVDHLLVEKNVAFNILGHAYFLEDGIEQGNIIQDNLGIFVRGSSSLLNVDITPATFWSVNPNNTIRRNAAAGGTHFGFWYRLPNHPTGPSFTTSISPIHLPLGEFSGNSAHSFGWYGLWVFPSYFPGGSDVCEEEKPAVFKEFLSWRNDKGLEFQDVGAVQVKDSIFLDNKFSGVEYTTVQTPWGDKGAVVSDTLIAAHTNLGCEDDITDVCTEAGVKLPHTYYFTVSNVTFYNFDQDNCHSIRACSFCRGPKQGGFESRFSGITFVNSPRLTKWQWMHEQVFRDLDGSLTGTRGGALIATSPVLPPSCTHHPASSEDSVNGSLCTSETEFVRFAMTEPVPSSLTFRDLNVTNDYGTSVLEYVFKRLILGAGYMAILPTQETYKLEWADGERHTNLSYNSLFSGMTNQTSLVINHETLQPIDEVRINNVVRNSSLAVPVAATADNGDWFSNTTTRNIYYLVEGSSSCPVDVPIRFSTFRCFYPDCVPPPPPEPPAPVAPGRPDITLLWSNTSIWPNNTLPQANEDVIINASQYVIVDRALPKLGRVTVLGGLELSNETDHRFEADLILILEQGRFVVGYPETPFEHQADIVLYGNKTSPVYRLPNGGPVVGSKAIGVLGQLILTGKARSPTWTFLQTTVNAGANQLTLTETVDWMAGEEIVIASTSFEANQAEVFTIASVSGITVTINGSFAHRHLAGTSNDGCCSVPIRAEVGLLSRNIRIMNGDPETARKDSFGCRVLVSTYIADSGIEFTGRAELQGVEFKGCGQKDFVEPFDPRYSLAFLSTGIATNVSYIRQCSVHDGYNVGIGVFGASDMILNDNVIFRTLGSSVQVTGNDHLLRHNLAVSVLFPGTYGIPEPLNDQWTAAYELVDTRNLMLIDNSAAGGGKAGYHTDGENCISKPFQAKWRGNIAHSTLHGIHLEYTDGHIANSITGCSAFNDFTIYSCYQYAIFAYNRAGVIISNAKLVNNYAAVFVIVIEPAALSHVKGNKEVNIIDSHIVASFDEQDANCTEYSLKPDIAFHARSHSGIQSPSNGHVGIITPSFNSAKGHFPKSPWWDISNYPAIGGLTTIRNVTFCKFNTVCEGKTERALMTHPSSEDCQHPVHLEDIKFQCVDEKSKFYNHDPKRGSINPSDCVDMDCDGLKKILIRDQDGSFSGSSGLHTMVSRSEIGWGETSPGHGVSDLRIPRTMVANIDGTKKNIAETFPNKGIYRGTTCDRKPDWNSYSCSGIDHLMMVMESLDADTEVRRLSPIGLAAGGYVDLINGPQDHGWCGGYTCQERISDFFMIVASGLEYLIGLTSTNPQDMRLRLLNANSDQRILSAIFYTTPQRLDVYVGGEYKIPTNAYRSTDGNINYNSSGNFIPSINASGGANYYNRTSKKLYIVIRGDNEVTIKTTAVVQVSLTVSVTVNDFFEENLISNLAFLLQIPLNKIRIVSVISESSRRRRATDPVSSTVGIEIGDPPADRVSDMQQLETNTTGNGTSPYNQTTPTTAPTANTTSFTELTNITTKMGELIQTGKVADQLNTTITGGTVTMPQPPHTDPTGGVRAMEGDGGPQPGDPGTANLTTFSERQEEEEQREEDEMQPIQLRIPTRLTITHQPSQFMEGARPVRSFEVTVYDINNQKVTNLGVGRLWELTASIVSGPSGARLTNPTVMMKGGVGNFTELLFSHPGTYALRFTVTYPYDTSFTVDASSVSVTVRQLRLMVAQQPPRSANTSFPLSSPTVVHLIDAATGELVTNHGWRDRSWFIEAVIVEASSNGVVGTNYSQPLSGGMATFINILIPNEGSHWLQFSVITEPASSSGELPRPVNSITIEVTKSFRVRVVVTYEEDFDTLVLSDNGTQFKTSFRVALDSLVPSSVLLQDPMVERGSIIVYFFAYSSDPNHLASFFDTLMSQRGRDALSFEFRGSRLNLATVALDPKYPLNVPLSTRTKIIIILCSVFGGVLLLIAAIFVLMYCCLKKKKSKSNALKIKVKPMETELNLYNDIYENSDALEDYPVFHLVSKDGPGSNIMVAKDSDSVYNGSYGRESPSSDKSVEYVVSKEVKVGQHYRKSLEETTFSFGESGERDYLMSANSSNNNNNRSRPRSPFSRVPSPSPSGFSSPLLSLPNVIVEDEEDDFLQPPVTHFLPPLPNSPFLTGKR